MSPILLALAAALQTAPIAVPASGPDSVEAADPFRPDTVLAASGSPRMVLVSSVDGGVAALRLSVPLVESPVEAGAGQVLRDLALARMEGLAGPVGARVGATRTPWGLVYTVEGAAADLEYLAYLLREALAEPNEGGVEIERSRLALSQAVARTAETPAGRLLDDLRRAAAPHLPPLHGTPGTVARLDAARIRSVWRRSHQPETMTLVIAAAVVPEVVLAAIRGMGAVATAAPPPLDAPAPPEGPRERPQSLRTWHGEAWSAGPLSDPRATVASLLLTQTVAEATDGFEAGVQLQALQDGWLLVVAGAAYSGEVRRMRGVVTGALERTRDGLSEGTVRAAVQRLCRQLLFDARTPSGLVGRIGREVEVTGSPHGASRYLDALTAVDLPAMSDYLNGLLAAGSVTAEVRP